MSKIDIQLCPHINSLNSFCVCVFFGGGGGEAGGGGEVCVFTCVRFHRNDDSLVWNGRNKF